MDKWLSYQALNLETSVQIRLPHTCRKALLLGILMKGGITETDTTVTIASILQDAGPVLTEGVKMVWTLVTGNPLLTLFVGVTVVGIGFKMFRKARKTAG